MSVRAYEYEEACEMQEVSRRLACKDHRPVMANALVRISSRSRRWPIRNSAKCGLGPVQHVAAVFIDWVFWLE